MTPLLSSALLRTQSDERLLTLAAQGHDRAFEAIVDRYRRPLLRYLHRLLPGDHAEDVLQAALVSAWTALRAGTDVRDLRPWLYRICHNGALNALARRGYDHAELNETLHGAASPVEALESRDAVRQTLASVAELPERQRDALLAVAVEGRPHGEVARELGLSDGALRQLVHRARSTVRSAVTAVTPAPVVNWVLQLGARGGAPRIAELVGGAGVAKAAAIVAATGAVVAGGATQVAGHHAGPAVAAAASPRSIAHTAPHALRVVMRGPRVHARHVTKPRAPRRATASLGGPTDRVVALVPPAPRRHAHRRPTSESTVTHGGATDQAPAAPTTSTAAPAPTPEATDPTPTTSVPAPAPAPEACHEVACRPATTPTEPAPPPPPPTEPPPPPPTDPPRI